MLEQSGSFFSSISYSFSIEMCTQHIFTIDRPIYGKLIDYVDICWNSVSSSIEEVFMYALIQINMEYDGKCSHFNRNKN